MYKIIVKQTVAKVVTKQKYDVVEMRPYTDEELANSNTYWRESDETKTRVKKVMGYLPPTEVEETEEREIYRQEVDVLDLHAVIKAVNGLVQTKAG